MASRRKPWYRARNLVLGFVVLLVVFVGREVYLAYTVERGSAIDYAQQLHELNLTRQGVGESDANGWGELEAAYAVMADVLATVEEESERSPPPEHVEWWGQREWPVGFRFLVDRRDVTPAVLEQTLRAASMIEAQGGLDHFKRAVAHEKVLPPKIDVRPLATAGAEGDARRYALILAWRVERAAAENRHEDLGEAATTLLGLARVYSTHGAVMDYLIGAACADRLFSSIGSVISRGELSEVEARLLIDCLDRHFELGGFGLLVEAARIDLLDGIQWSYTPGGRRILYHSDGFLPGRIGGDHPLFNCASFFFPRRDSDVKEANRFFDAWSGLAAMSASEFAAASDPSRALTGKGVVRGAAEFLVPPIDKLRQAHDRILLTHDGTRLMLALEAHRARSGAYPDALDSLAPDLVDAPVVDPVSDRPFGYRLFGPGEDELGRAYLLYSYGVDQQDDGGAELRGRYGAIQASPGTEPEVGFDFVINAPVGGES